MNIRMLTEEDAAIYQSLRLQGLLDNPEAFGSTYKETKDRPLSWFAERIQPQSDPIHSFVLGAFNIEGTLIGNIGFLQKSQLKVRHQAMIWGMYVLPEMRGQGIAKALLQSTIERASSLPEIEQLHLSVVTTNNAARHLYRSLGFEVYGLEKHALKQNGIYFDEELMVLFL